MSGQIIDLQSRKPVATLEGSAHCRECGHSWQAVIPVGHVVLECPACRTFKGVFDYGMLPEKGTIWRCNCGNDLFIIRPEGLLCYRCGAVPSFPQDGCA